MVNKCWKLHDFGVMDGCLASLLSPALLATGRLCTREGGPRPESTCFVSPLAFLVEGRKLIQDGMAVIVSFFFFVMSFGPYTYGCKRALGVTRKVEDVPVTSLRMGGVQIPLCQRNVDPPLFL